MEINQENIEFVVQVLMMGKFNQAMKTASDYFQIAKELMEQFPNLTPEEIGQEYEKMCEKQKSAETQRFANLADGNENLDQSEKEEEETEKSEER